MFSISSVIGLFFAGALVFLANAMLWIAHAWNNRHDGSEASGPACLFMVLDVTGLVVSVMTLHWWGFLLGVGVHAVLGLIYNLCLHLKFKSSPLFS